MDNFDKEFKEEFERVGRFIKAYAVCIGIFSVAFLAVLGILGWKLIEAL